MPMVSRRAYSTSIGRGRSAIGTKAERPKPQVVSSGDIGNLDEALERLQAAEFEFIVMDTAGVNDHGTRGAMRAADLCLIPLRPE